jgi:hypothetical protein
VFTKRKTGNKFTEEKEKEKGAERVLLSYDLHRWPARSKKKRSTRSSCM